MVNKDLQKILKMMVEGEQETASALLGKYIKATSKKIHEQVLREDDETVTQDQNEVEGEEYFGEDDVNEIPDDVTEVSTDKDVIEDQFDDIEQDFARLRAEFEKLTGSDNADEDENTDKVPAEQVQEGLEMQPVRKVANADGTLAGNGGRFSQNTKSSLPKNGRDDEPTPVQSKNTTAKGYNREKAPTTKTVRGADNSRKKGTDGTSRVSNKGPASAELNKSLPAPNNKSPIGSVKK